MWVCKYFVEFILFSFLGWVWETVYCTICHKKWQSRGFLFGPVCPIYGFGAMGGFAVVDILKLCNAPPLSWQMVLLIGFFGSAVLEFFTSLLLEKLFHAYWWDYSRLPLNIQGRISLFTSCGFALAGLFVVFVAYPYCNSIYSLVPPSFTEFTALMFAGALAVDTALTVSSLSDILHRLQMLDDNINDHMTEFVDGIYSSTSAFSRKVMTKIKGVRFKKTDQVKVFQKLMDKIKNKR